MFGLGKVRRIKQDNLKAFHKRRKEVVDIAFRLEDRKGTFLGWEFLVEGKLVVALSTDDFLNFDYNTGSTITPSEKIAIETD